MEEKIENEIVFKDTNLILQPKSYPLIYELSLILIMLSECITNLINYLLIE